VPVPVGIQALKGMHMLKALTKLQTRIATRDKGATAVEYGLLVALIAAVIVAIVLVLGRQVSTAFQSVSDAI
jgi:pilus assembly protein Flp/PilA